MPQCALSPGFHEKLRKSTRETEREHAFIKERKHPAHRKSHITNGTCINQLQPAYPLLVAIIGVSQSRVVVRSSIHSGGNMRKTESHCESSAKYAQE